jgi:hypothetical protein
MAGNDHSTMFMWCSGSRRSACSPLSKPLSGQTFRLSVPVDHIILAPSPYGLDDSILQYVFCRGVILTKRPFSKPESRLKTCNVRLQPVDLAKLRHRRLANRRRRIPPGHAHISYQDISKTCPAIPTMDNSQECRDKDLGLLSVVPGIGRYPYIRCLTCRARGRRVSD